MGKTLYIIKSKEGLYYGAGSFQWVEKSKVTFNMFYADRSVPEHRISWAKDHQDKEQNPYPIAEGAEAFMAHDPRIVEGKHLFTFE